MESEAGYELVASSALGSLEQFSLHCDRITGSIRESVCFVDIDRLDGIEPYLKFLSRRCPPGEWADQLDLASIWYYLYRAELPLARYEPEEVFRLLGNAWEVLNAGTLRRRAEGRQEKPNSEARWNMIRLEAAALAISNYEGGEQRFADLCSSFAYIKRMILNKLQVPFMSQAEIEVFRHSLALAELALIKLGIACNAPDCEGMTLAFADEYNAFISPIPGYFRTASRLEALNRYFPNLELFKLSYLDDFTIKEVDSLQRQQTLLSDNEDKAHRTLLAFSQQCEREWLMKTVAIRELR